MDCTPSGTVLRALASQNLDFFTVLAEWIDNAFDWGSQCVQITFDRVAKKTVVVSVKDDGVGCSDFRCFFRLGEHRKSRGLGRFGFGSKDAALYLGGEESTLEIASVQGGKRRALRVRWSDLAANNWQAREPEIRDALPGEIGTQITVTPVIRRVPDGARWAELLDEIGYRYAPALKRGKQITIRSKKGGVAGLVVRWEPPPLEPGHVNVSVDVGGKRARVYCGIIREGQSCTRRGLTYFHEFRVIKPACGKGCGEHSTARICGFVELDDSWQFTKNKDDIQHAEELYAAVEEKLSDILRRADQVGAQMASEAFRKQVEAILNHPASADSRAKRGKGDSEGSKEPTGKGRPHRNAKDEQDGKRFPSRRRRAIRIDYARLGREDDLGYFQDGTVTLNLDNAGVRSARDGENVEATAGLAACLVAIRECSVPAGDRQTRLRAIDEADLSVRFRRAMGELLAKPIAINGTDVANPNVGAA